MATRPRQRYSNRPPSRAAVIVTAFAAVAALASLMLGLAMVGVDLTPDPVRGEAFGVTMVQDWLLQRLVISEFFAVGAGFWGFALLSGRWRLAPSAAILLSLVGAGCAVAARLI